MSAPRGVAIRRDAGLWGYERALARAGLAPVAGADEAGRGACAGPLVVAAVVLPDGRRGQVPGLADSKLLTADQRRQVYAEVVRRASAWSVVVIPSTEVDRIGLHVANVQGMRRALLQLGVRPAYVLTDGFPVRGLGAPTLAVWKGDRVAACIAAASVIAKVTRDDIMGKLDDAWPQYGFADHKGYATPSHSEALAAHGPCPEHRFSYVNIASRALADARVPTRTLLRLAGRPGEPLRRDGCARTWPEEDNGRVGVLPAQTPPTVESRA